MDIESLTKQSAQYFSKRRCYLWMGISNISSYRQRTLRIFILLVCVFAFTEVLTGGIIKSLIYNKYLVAHNISSDAEGLATRDQVQSIISLKESTNLKIRKKDLLTTDNISDISQIELSRLLKNIKRRVNHDKINRVFIVKNEVYSNKFSELNDSDILCDEVPPGLGPISANKGKMELNYVENKFPEVDAGGFYTPPNCTARHKVAIIVPYRDRKKHLAKFLNHMHPILMKQQLEYGIFIIEQAGKELFNRAKLKNVGAVESQRLKEGGWECFVFHDVDLLPLDERIMYSCPVQPRHMSVVVDSFANGLPYSYLFGGVVAMTVEQFITVNGFSNNYWGWGAEDDDMSLRLEKCNYRIERYNRSLAKYTMLKHKKEPANPGRFMILSKTAEGFMKDGLTTLRYKFKKLKRHHLYTHILVNIHDTL